MIMTFDAVGHSTDVSIVVTLNSGTECAEPMENRFLMLRSESLGDTEKRDIGWQIKWLCDLLTL